MAKKSIGELCLKCGAIGDCCAASDSRRKTATTLSSIVQHLSTRITELNHELENARGVIADLRAKTK